MIEWVMNFLENFFDLFKLSLNCFLKATKATIWSFVMFCWLSWRKIVDFTSTLFFQRLMLDKNIFTFNPGRIIMFWKLLWSFHIGEKLWKNLRVKKKSEQKSINSSSRRVGAPWALVRHLSGLLFQKRTNHSDF